MANTQQNVSLVVIGDSYTDYSPHTYATTLQACLKGVRVINKGIGGDTSIDVERRLERDVLSLKPDMVYMMIGGNDILGGENDVDSVVNRITGMLERCSEAGIIPIIGLYRLPLGFYRAKLERSEEEAQRQHANMDALHDKLALYGNEHKINYVKIDEGLLPDGEHYYTRDFNFPNDIHPSASGANKMGNLAAKKIAQFVVKNLNKLKSKATPYGGNSREVKPQTKMVLVAGDCFSAEYNNVSWVNMAQYAMPEAAFKCLYGDTMDMRDCVNGFDAAKRYNPDYILAAVGLCDCARDDFELEKTIQDINNFGVKCWDIGAIPIFAVAQPSLKYMVSLFGEEKGKLVFDRSILVNKYYREAATQYDKVEVIEDIFTPIKTNGEFVAKYLAGDKVHLSLEGAEKVGKYIAEKLKNIVE